MGNGEKSADDVKIDESVREKVSLDNLETKKYHTNERLDFDIKKQLINNWHNITKIFALPIIILLSIVIVVPLIYILIQLPPVWDNANNVVNETAVKSIGELIKDYQGLITPLTSILIPILTLIIGHSIGKK